MYDIIKTQDGGRPSEDFNMFSSVIIMPVHSYTCMWKVNDTIYLKTIPLEWQHYLKNDCDIIYLTITLLAMAFIAGLVSMM